MRKHVWMMAVSVLFALAACSGGGSDDGGGSGGGLAINTAGLPNGALNLAYNATIEATPSLATYTWSYSGTLPPGLTLDTSSTTYTTTLSGTPTADGTYNFTVEVSVAGDSASRAYTVDVAASGFPPGVSVTDVTVDNTVRVNGVKKLGLNLGGHSRWGAAKILKNQLPNPGFEPGVMGTVWLADSSSTTDSFTPELWDANSGSQSPGFWDGADFEIVYGPGVGTSGTVSSFTHSGTDYNFNLGSNGNTALNQYDVMFTRRDFPGEAYGMHGGTGTVETNNPYSGEQCLRLSSGDSFNYVMDTSWRDGDQSSHKLHVIEGNWRVRLKARSANGTQEIRVRFRRDGGLPYGVTFFDETFTGIGTNWSTESHDETVAQGTDQTPEPWPSGTYRPALVFELSVPAGNTDDVFIDEVELYRVDEATNPTVFADRFVDRLQDYNPGVLRWWSGQLGETLDNMTKPWAERGTVGYKPSHSSPGGWNYGAHDFFELCDHIGAEPWIVIPPTASTSELQNFMEYLAGTSGTYANRRIGQGQTAPWTSVFDKIHIEYGNELWGAGTPGDPFGGASLRGGVRLGECADRAFEIMKATAHYTGNAGAFSFVIGGQAGYSGRQQEIEANSNDHDSTALAPYFGVLDQYGTDQEMYGPLFAKPFYDALNANGRMYESRQFLNNGGNGTSMSIYEINYHTTSTSYTVSTSRRNEFVAGASGAIALPLHMLVYMTELEAIEQCAFTSLGYAYRFDTSGGWPPSQDQFVHIWGMLRDLYHYDIRRPTWMGVELANKAVMGDAITTTHGGDDPEWIQSAINGVGAATTVKEVQSFAFRDGNNYGIVLMNLSLTDQQGVRLNVPGTPQSNATIYAIEPNDINDVNATTEVVALDTTNINNFQNGYEMVMPRHSIRAIIWTD